jgi:hypothetical protein
MLFYDRLKNLAPIGAPLRYAIDRPAPQFGAAFVGSVKTQRQPAIRQRGPHDSVAGLGAPPFR